MEIKEKVIINNFYGSVTNQRVVYNIQAGSFSEISIKKIYSISFRRKHNMLPAFIYFAFSIILLIALLMAESSKEVFGNMSLLLILFGVIIIAFLFLISMFHYLGHHIIAINEVGKDRIIMKVKLLKTKEGREFIDAIEKQIALNSYY